MVRVVTRYLLKVRVTATFNACSILFTGLNSATFGKLLAAQ